MTPLNEIEENNRFREEERRSQKQIHIYVAIYYTDSGTLEQLDIHMGKLKDLALTSQKSIVSGEW